MSAPLRPAARTRTSSCPSWGSGSGCSATSIRPSRMVAARMTARLLPVRLWCSRRQIGYKVDVGVPLPALPPALARKSRRCRGGRAVPQLGLARRRRARRRGPPGAADPRLHGRRRLAGDDDPLAARERLPHAPRRDPRQRRLLARRTCARLEARLEGFAEAAGERVAIIGQSRGGVFARVLAARRPDLVSRDRHARLARPSASSARTRSCSPRSLVVGALGTGRVPGMFRMRCLRGACCERFRADLAGAFPPEVGFTALYSRTDGVVDWHACLDPAAEQIEVRASHLGMGLNAEVYAEVGHALGTLRARRGRVLGRRPPRA